MTVTEPQSIAVVLALALVATLATAAPGQVQLAGQPTSISLPEGVSGETTSPGVHHYGILGQVGRPGVYVSVHDDLTLSELVAAAGGTTPRAGGSAQVIRRGHTGPRMNCSPPSSSPLAPGDVVVVLERTAAERSKTMPEWVAVALVGIVPDEPVVVLLPASLTELPQLISALQQRPVLIDSMRVLRPSMGRLQNPVDQPPAQLFEGDVVVFDPTTIDRRALAQAESFPPPVLIPERARRPDVEMVIRPQQRLSVSGPTLPTTATVAANRPAAVEEHQNDIGRLMQQSDRGPERPTSPTPAFPESPPMTRAAEDQPLAADEDAASIETTDEAEDEPSSGSSRTVVATSLVAALPESPPRERLAGIAAARPEPERMATPQVGAMLALADNAQRQPAPGWAAADDEAGIEQVAALQEEVPAPSDPPGAGASPGIGMRALTVGITVLGTALICFAASLLWSRLDDSTGLPGTVTGRRNESLPIQPLTERRSTLERLINNALPIIEEPTLLPEGTDFHGEAVGRRRLRIDAEQNLSGPHFAAPQQTPQPVAVPETAGTANTRPNREDSTAGMPSGDAAASPGRGKTQRGLLDRVLVAMERERRR